MSTANHLPRAWAGPGKRPGIAAPGGRHLNSISRPLDIGSYYAPTVRAARVVDDTGKNRCPWRDGCRPSPGRGELRGLGFFFFLIRGRAGILAFGLGVAVDEFDQRHCRVVAITVAGLDDASVAAGTVCIALRHGCH